MRCTVCRPEAHGAPSAHGAHSTGPVRIHAVSVAFRGWGVLRHCAHAVDPITLGRLYLSGIHL